MSFSHETQEKINQFTKEQSRHYLDAAEMTYIEKLRRKTSQTKQKIGRRLSRFKSSSDQAREAQNDMLLYMSDYMNDLISQGISEKDAFDKAKEELAISEEFVLHADLHERFRQYYEKRDPADYEAAELLYGGFLFIGIVIGALSGYILSGGRQEFLNGGWIDTLVGIGAGALFGMGLGLVSNAFVINKNKK